MTQARIHGAALLLVAIVGCRPARAGEAAIDPAGLYDRYCLPCHGATGKGDGPAAPWLWPRPRDFAAGVYKWRSTPSGAAPTDADLAAAIRDGVPGTSMHGFGVALDAAQIDALVATVKAFAPAKFAKPAAALALGDAPAVTDALVARGKAVWTELGCASCHGAGGAGDGTAAATLKPRPYDLTAQPVRRPGGASLAGIHASLVTGLDGTPMPSYAEAAGADDLWAVAAFVDSMRWRGDPTGDRTLLDIDAVYAVTPDDLAAGYWPGDPSLPDARVWGGDIAPHGAPPEVLAPAQASLQPAQCGRCHAKQLREWRGSLHAQTASPGTIGQTARLAPDKKQSCWRCHAPLPEQLDTTAVYDQSLRDESIACAACHVRGWTRFGPPKLPDARLLAQPGYPFEALPIYERSDFCLPCHQLPPWNVKLVADSKTDAGKRKPLLNTYREWLEGPYMRRGVQCQHCHMPNREHTFLGVHDPETFRQGVELEAIAARSARTGAVSVRARLGNVGAGHSIPTTPTPAAYLDVELLDARERPIDGASATLRIGRHLDYDPKANLFHEREDTRIAPGERIELARAWQGGGVPGARWARIRVRVEPDEYYEREFTRRLADQRLDADVRALFEAALARTKASKYTALERKLAL